MTRAAANGLELVRSVAERMLQELIEAEATAKIGAEWHEHTGRLIAYRSGQRDKKLTPQVGDLDLAILKLRSGASFPYCWSGGAGSTRPCMQ